MASQTTSVASLTCDSIFDELILITGAARIVFSKMASCTGQTVVRIGITSGARRVTAEAVAYHDRFTWLIA